MKLTYIARAVIISLFFAISASTLSQPITIHNEINKPKEENKSKAIVVHGAIQFDPVTHLAKSTLPFDQQVILQIPIHSPDSNSNDPQNVFIFETTSSFYYRKRVAIKNLKRKTKELDSSWKYIDTIDKSFLIYITPKPNRYYYIVTSDTTASSINDSLPIPKSSDPVIRNKKVNYYLANSFTSGLEKNIKHFFSADIGVIYIPDFKDKPFAPFIGVNMYWRPSNRDLLQRQVKNKNNPLYGRYPVGPFILRRFGLKMGLTLTSLAADYKREDIMGNLNLLTGINYQLTQMVNLSTGALWYTKLHENPLVNQSKTDVTYYVSISFDLSINSIAEDFTSKIK